MTTENQNVTMYQGETKNITAAITDSNGTALDLTGATAVTWKMFTSVDSSTAVLTKTLGSGIMLVNVNGTNDGVKIALAKADTSSLTVRTYYHECRVADVSNNEEVVFTGSLILKESKTI